MSIIAPISLRNLIASARVSTHAFRITPPIPIGCFNVSASSSRPLRLPTPSRLTSLPPLPTPPTRLPTITSQIPIGAFRRAFTTSRLRSIRQTYFPSGSGRSGGGSGQQRGGPSWWTQFKYRIDRIPSQTIVWGLIGLNIAVFLLWQYAIESLRRFRDPTLYMFLSKNFILTEANIMAGRVWTLLTACFSQSTGSHILMNCLGLYFIAPGAAAILGSSSFLGLYLAGGLFSSLTSLAWRRVSGDRRTGSEGASGAIYATLSFFAAMRPNTTFLLFFVIPMPAWAMVSGIFAWDLFSSVGRPSSGTDSPGHMGGIAAGVIAAFVFRKRAMMGGGGRRW